MTDQQKKDLKNLEQEKDAIKITIKRLEGDRLRKQKRRANFRQIKEVSEQHPEVAAKLKKFSRDENGRPTLETDQPYLHTCILKLASVGGAADSRRRTEIINSCRTLDDLSAALKKEDLQLSRIGLYLRLLLRRSLSHEGRRHVNTVPVKLQKAQNTGRRSHVDQYFVAATINYLKNLATEMGERCVFFLSQDDKARIPLGLPAAHKQAPILMHMEYVVQLPDHDWVVAEGHKLIPSVYAACILKNKCVSYSGPTFIAIRSAYHDSSTAFSHAADFEKLTSLAVFVDVMCTETGAVKPILIMTVDGGPDENPRYPNTLTVAAHHFKSYNLDAIFIGTNAPGHSAYNAVERRMAPLSHDLSGLILPHDAFGSHLDEKGKILDQELAKKNFALAGETLASVWSKTVIDGFPVAAQYCSPNEDRLSIAPPTEEWKMVHVRQSKYCLQIVRCSHTDCCGEWRTNLLHVLPDRFMPAPIKFMHQNNGIVASQFDDGHGRFGLLSQRIMLHRLQPKTDFKQFPFDFYCPSVRDQLAKCICQKCGLYFPSQAAAKRHAPQSLQLCEQ